MDDDTKRKDPRVAGALALVGGPIGFLYLGWRYALAATVLFLALLMAFAFLLFAPPWLKYVNLPAFAFMAYTICERLNDLLERGQHRAVLEAKSLPVAVFALTSMLPLLAAFDSAVFGVATALPQLMRGDIGGGLMLLLVVTPLLALASFVGFVLIASLIDRGVMRWAPAAPRFIFPPVVSLGKGSS